MGEVRLAAYHKQRVTYCIVSVLPGRCYDEYAQTEADEDIISLSGLRKRMHTGAGLKHPVRWMSVVAPSRLRPHEPYAIH